MRFTLTVEMPAGTKSSKQMKQGGTMIVNALQAIVETGKLPLGTRALYVLFTVMTPLTPKRCLSERSPKKGYVSYRRSKQFVLVQPSTATRIDVGIQLKGVAPTARLEASGSFNAMVSHRVRIESLADIDAELRGWLKQAYEGA